ncbi:hypothetical protein ABZ345_45700 [Lentzea sp. NPDC005914]|uniref:hypothetical protein n=1 Tax=Lentzea sp. NPDC005914 TaxID=3154572 RepID=UPI0033F5773F
MKIFRHLTTTLVTYGVIIAGCTFALCVATVFAVSSFTEVQLSAWSVVAAQIARWFCLWAGVYAIHTVLPIAIAHGRTRREFMVATAEFTVVFALAMAVCAWLGFLVEGGLYSLMDWSSQGDHGQPYAYFLMYLAWGATGTFVSAAFDRFGPGGVLSLPIGLLLVIASGERVPGSGELPFIRNVPVLLGAGWHAVSFVAWLVALGLAWLVVREMPVRTKAL